MLNMDSEEQCATIVVVNILKKTTKNQENLKLH